MSAPETVKRHSVWISHYAANGNTVWYWKIPYRKIPDHIPMTISAKIKKIKQLKKQ